MSGAIFPKWVNRAKLFLGLGLLAGPVYLTVLFAYGAQPVVYDIGYAPKQPVEYSHALHVGELGLDCRYCHTAVEKAPHANIPLTQTCMTCHAHIKPKSAKLQTVRDSYYEGTAKPIPWNKVHKLPDFVYFNHSAHVGRNYKSTGGANDTGAGIGCVSCHGRVDQMEVVAQVQPLSMSWCLDCHRNPENHLRPIATITKMDYVHDVEVGKKLAHDYKIRPSQDCSTCHR